jgi:DNA-binding winged helix-turn-helix (wHTH) protein
MADLPPPGRNRWSVRRKAEVIAAVCGGLISLRDARRIYHVSIDEFVTWRVLEEKHGRQGLRVTHIHVYRAVSRRVEPAQATLPNETSPSSNVADLERPMVIRVGDLVINFDTKTVKIGNTNVHCTGKEFQILEVFSSQAGNTVTREMFLNHLYGGKDEPGVRIIDVFICKLRKKLANASGGKDYIETVWGRGHVLRDPAEPNHGDNVHEIMPTPLLSELSARTRVLVQLIGQTKVLIEGLNAIIAAEEKRCKTSVESPMCSPLAHQACSRRKKLSSSLEDFVSAMERMQHTLDHNEHAA